jgi:predicted methyltransferase
LKEFEAVKTFVNKTPRMIQVVSIVATAVVLGMIAPIAHASSADELQKTLSSGDRPEADKARDAGRRPAEVVTFLGIEPGMTVVDLMAGGGYYTDVLSAAVGASGKVYAQNTERGLSFRDGANEKAISARLAGNRLKNVERLNREFSDLGLEPGSVDAALTALNYHDIANGGGPEAAASFLSTVLGILRPGGILGLIDHDAKPGNDNAALHRIPKIDALTAVMQAGFEVVGEGKMLHNPDDDHSKMVFAEGMRGKTDRFVLLLRKPLAVE